MMLASRVDNITLLMECSVDPWLPQAGAQKVRNVGRRIPHKQFRSGEDKRERVEPQLSMSDPEPKLPEPDPDPESFPPQPVPVPTPEPEEPGPDVIDPGPELLPA